MHAICEAVWDVDESWGWGGDRKITVHENNLYSHNHISCGIDWMSLFWLRKHVKSSLMDSSESCFLLCVNLCVCRNCPTLFRSLLFVCMKRG